MILYINADGEPETPAETTKIECEKLEPSTAADCKTATDVPKDKECQFVAKKEGVADSKNACKLVTKATSSSNLINIFKITFALLIIFTIL